MVMACETPAEKTASLKALATEVFKEQTFEDVKTGIGIVTTKWINDRPMVFKASKDQAHGRYGTFKPGFPSWLGLSRQLTREINGIASPLQASRCICKRRRRNLLREPRIFRQDQIKH
jgi:hypothetical protein